MNMLAVLIEKEQALKSWDRRRKQNSSNFLVSDVPYSASPGSFTHLPSCVVLDAD